MIKINKTIVISSPAGDPRNSQTWSCTPNNIIKTLENRGIDVVAIDTSLSFFFKIGSYALHHVFGFVSDYKRGFFARKLSSKVLYNRVKNLNCNKILHMSTLDLPIHRPESNISHYLFIDFTRDLLYKYFTINDKYSTRTFYHMDRLERKSYNQIKHFFSASNYVRDNLINKYGIDSKRITVVGTGRGKIAPFTGEKNYQKGHILFVSKGNFERKGGMLLINGFKIAQKKNPLLKLIIVGGKQYKEIIGDLPNVIFKSYLSWKELEYLFHTASLFAMPAINEPWGLVYLEALACKTPILGLNRNSLPEITCNGQYGFLVDKPEPILISKAILNAFSDIDRLRNMGNKGQKYCLETFTWDRTIDKMLHVIFENKNLN